MRKYIVKLPDVVGKGYSDVWQSKDRYIAIKGGRSSKKSKTIALRWMYLLTKYPKSSLLVIRQTYRTHISSTFADLVWAATRLGVSANWHISTGASLFFKNKVTGQEILFRGCDDTLGVTSITVKNGILCWCWFEEAYQVKTFDTFLTIDGAIRGELPEGYFLQTVLTFNPWSSKHWLKKTFFDKAELFGYKILSKTVTYRLNEFDPSAKQRYEAMKIEEPNRYRIEGDGEWGISSGLVFPNHTIVTNFSWKAMLQIKNQKGYLYQAAFGLDFGWSDPTALICFLVSTSNNPKKEIFIFDEIYKHRTTPEELARLIIHKGYGGELIYADSSRPDTIKQLQNLGISRCRPVRKAKIMDDIVNLQDYKIKVAEELTNTIIELENYRFDEGNKNKDKPIDEFNHLMDALRYGFTVISKDTFSFD